VGIANAGDIELVLLAKQGQATAFGELVRRYRPLCVRKAMSVMRKADVEDEVQDAVLQAFLHLNEFELRASFSTWLIRIVVNRCLMTVRRNRALPITSIDASFEDVPFLYSSERNPEELFYARELAVLIARTAQRLPQPHRLALAAHIDNPGGSHLTATLGLSLAAAKARLHRARRQLRAGMRSQFQTRYSKSGFELLHQSGVASGAHLSSPGL
jgi:RNA polymerase sigma-70 factor, ECF subfamily